MIAVGEEGRRGLVLADEPARTCYLPGHRAFDRWLAADSEIMDSATAGADLDVAYPDGGGLPEQAAVAIGTGLWSVRAAHTWAAEGTLVGLLQLRRAADN